VYPLPADSSIPCCSDDQFHEESSEIHHHHAYIEFLTGLLAAQPFPSGELKKPTVSQCDEIWQWLQDYYTAVQRDLIGDALEPRSCTSWRSMPKAIPAWCAERAIRTSSNKWPPECTGMMMAGGRRGWVSRSARRWGRCGRGWGWGVGETMR